VGIAWQGIHEPFNPVEEQVAAEDEVEPFKNDDEDEDGDAALS
jgi:hypothetical protein